MKIANKLRAHAMESIKSRGIPTPKKLPPMSEEQDFPTDMTTLSGNDVRAQMSYWIAQAERANHELSLVSTDVVHCRNLLDQAARFAKATSTHREVWKVEAELEQDADYLKTKERLQKAKAVETVLKAARDRFNRYYEALSRELTARLAEMERRQNSSRGDG